MCGAQTLMFGGRPTTNVPPSVMLNGWIGTCVVRLLAIVALKVAQTLIRLQWVTTANHSNEP
jgi:hypothetical protein